MKMNVILQMNSITKQCPGLPKDEKRVRLGKEDEIIYYPVKLFLKKSRSLDTFQY
jgi:hypothetical protein